MKIGLQTWGSHGDIRPFLALAQGLQAAGHEVTLVLTCVDSDRYTELQATSAFALQVVASPVVPERWKLEAAGAAVVAERNAIRQTALAIEHFLLPAEAAMARASEQLCAANNLVIGHYFLYTLGVAAERSRRPWVSVALAHGGVPTAFQPPAGLRDLGAFGNRLARSHLNRTLKRYPDRLRAQHGMAPARDLMETVWASTDLTLLAISPVLCPPRPDWPAHYRVCGALNPLVCGALATSEAVTEGAVPDTLEAFLASGAPPVYLTLGSMMAGSDEQETTALLVEAARAASVRAIVQAPRWVEWGFRNDPALHFVRSAPHARLFPRCSAVVHHGGAGTAHAIRRPCTRATPKT